MLAQFVRNTSLYTVSSLFSKGLGLLLLPVFTRLLTPEDYGALDLLIAFGGVVNVVVALEISQGLARYWPLAASERGRRDYAATCLVFTTAAYLVFAISAVASASVLSTVILGSNTWVPLLYLAIPTIALGGIFYLLQVQFSYELRPYPYVATSATYAVLAAAISLLLLLFTNIGVMAIYTGQLVALTIAIALSLHLLRQSISGSFDWEKLRKMLAFSFPLVLSSVAFVLFIYIDRLIISRLLSLNDVGLFGIGQRIASVVALVVIGMQTALTPLIYHHHKKAETPLQLAQMLRVACGFQLALALVLGLFAPEIIAVIAAHDYAGGAAVVFPLALAAVFSNLYVFAPGLSLANKTWIIALINLAGLSLNLALCLVLTTAFGISGTALATAAASAVLLGTKLYFGHRYYPVPYAWGRFGTALAFCAGVILTSNAMGLDNGISIGLVGVKLLLMATGILGIACLLMTRDEIRACTRQLHSG